MGRLISVEKSQFTNRNIEIFSKNKVGQYSKFLDKQPIFVTYYQINQQMSRADTGTGGIDKEIGPDSPIRYNKITNFPLYNLTEMKPDVEYDDGGYDVNLDLSDLVLLPNTLKPIPGSYFVVSYPGIKEHLFRVNNFRYNTIQSNDFYNIDADLKDIQTDCISVLDHQVVETYQTIFENIGTQDKCFLNNTEIDKINTLVHTFDTFRDLYYNAFYSNECNSFTFKECTDTASWLYDPYLEAFINKALIFFEDNADGALVLTPNDLLDTTFDFTFNRMLYNAILTRSMKQLSKWCYYYKSSVSKKFSTFITNHIPCDSVKIMLTRDELYTSIDDPAHFNETPILHFPQCITPAVLGDSPYYRKEFMVGIQEGKPEGFDYFETIIYNYLYNIKTDISTDLMYEYVEVCDMKVFMYLPLVLYIMTQYYKEYFANSVSYQI